MTNSAPSRLGELANLFFKLGVIGFGGPVAHIAMIEDEVVKRRQWLTKEHFLDLLGATNLIPGPNSTEMAIHIGYIYAGWLGLIVSGVCFILPAVLITGVFAWVYVTYGTLPQVAPLLYGIKPTVLAIIINALWGLAKKAVKTRQLLVIALAVALLTLLLKLNEVIALLIGGLLGMLWLHSGEKKFTPDPVLSTATFIGYIIAGIPGAIVATIGIFLPSFVFVAALNPLIPRLRASSWTRAFLDAVNVSAIALMVITTLQLGAATLTLPQAPFVDFLGIAIAIVSAILAIRLGIKSAWLVFGSALIGWGASLLGYT